MIKVILLSSEKILKLIYLLFHIGGHPYKSVEAMKMTIMFKGGVEIALKRMKKIVER